MPTEPVDVAYLELTAGTCHAHGGLIAHNLGGDHRDCLTLCRINLAGHDATAWLVFREAQFAEPAARTRTEETDVVGNLHQGASNDIERAVGFNKGIMVGKRLKLSQRQSIAPVMNEVTCLVWRSLKVETGDI